MPISYKRTARGCPDELFVFGWTPSTMADSEKDNSSAPDPKEKFLSALRESIDGGTFLRLMLGKYRGDADLKQVVVRRIVIKGEECLSLTLRHQTKDVTRNVALAVAEGEIGSLIAEGFRSAHLFTSVEDLQLEFNKRGKGRLSRSRPTMTDAASPDHDRSKQRLVSADRPWLLELGVTDGNGKVLPSMSDKWRQINKFVEVLDSSFTASPLVEKDKIQIVDFGSGKGYLTFAMHEHLSGASTLGVELRAELADKCNAAARKCEGGGLSFKAGDIGDCDLPAIDIMVALHACDTATDLAIHQGISKGAALILCAPCCHKEIRPQIQIPEVLQPMLRHGIHLGTEADMVTDTMRALLLEGSGYVVKVFEFISLEHTSKNKMITAVANGTPARAAAAREEFSRLKEFYGIRQQRLAELLEI